MSIKRSIFVLLMMISMLLSHVSPNIIQAEDENETSEEAKEPVYLCNLEEHTHDDNCYKKIYVLDCEDKHEHIKDCYEELSFFTCSEIEHTHNELCLEEPTETKQDEEEEERKTYCDKEEHTHDLTCYEETKNKILNCDKDHEHDEDCYITESKLVCETEEHTHDEECYIEKDKEWVDEPEVEPDGIEPTERKPRALMKTPFRNGNEVDPLEIRTFLVQFFYGAELNDNDDYVWTAPYNNSGHRFSYRINYAISGKFELEPNSIEMRIPKSILVDRDGSPADTYEMSIPTKKEVDDGEEIDMDINYAYYEDGDDIVIYNFREVYTGENGYIELSYFTSKSSYDYYDYGHENAGSKDFFATIKVTGNGKTVTDESEHFKVFIDTGVNIQSIDKKFPSLFTDWSLSWGPKPDDADHYNYLMWSVVTVVRPDTQPYDLTIFDHDLSDGEIYAMRGSGEYGFTKVSDLPDGKLVVRNEVGTGSRIDYVLTRHDKQWWYDQGDHIEIENHIDATVDPIDQVDPDTSAKGARTYVYNRPTFVHPMGVYDSFKRSDRSYIPTDFGLSISGGKYSRYDLERLIEGEVEYLDHMDYAVWMEGYPGVHTVLNPLDYDDTSKYFEVPVKYELYDYIFFLYDEKDGIVNPNVGLDDETYGIPIQEYIDNRMTYQDFQIDTLKFGTSGYNDADFGETIQKFYKVPVVYDDDDELVFYALFGENNTLDDWIEVARYNLKTNEATFDSAYVKEINNKTLFFQDNCVAYKVETLSRHYHTKVELVPDIRIKNSERVMDFLKNHNGGVDAIGILNSETANFYPYDPESDSYDTRFVTRSEASSDYLRRSYRTSHIRKNITATSNLVRKRRYTINWQISMDEHYTVGTGNSEHVEQNSGTFYDLLPPGSVINEQSIAVGNGSGFLDDGDFTYELINDYNGTGKTLLIVKILEPGDYYSLYYETYHSWDSIKDWGNDVYNPVAYETGNHNIAPFNEEGEREAYPDTIKNQFLDIVGGSSEDKFIYADTEYDIDILTAAAANLHKKVRDVTDADFSYDTWTTSNSDYYYRWRYQNTLDTKAKDLIFFDTLENYPEEQEDGSFRQSDWYGTLQFVDVSHPKNLGAEPVIYYSSIPNLNLEDHHDLTDTSVWEEASQFGDITNAKAIAVDLRKTPEGEDFLLGNNESVQIVLRMKAPQSARRDDGYPEAYNNIYLENTTIDNEGGSAHFFIHQDYTVIRFIVTGDFKLKKVNEENENQAIPKIKFRLFGKSDYGNQINIEKETDRTGKISFDKVEMGTYILQEYEASDDWLVDYTEHRVVIDENGVVTIDGEVYTENDELVLTNKPRVHGDLFLQKRREGTSAEEAELIENIVANGPGYRFEYEGQEHEVMKIVGKYAYIRDAFPKFEYPTFENAGPDIASGYCRINPEHPEAPAAYRITSDGELIIGTEGETQYLPSSSNLSAETVYPWQGNSNVKAVRFVGNVVAPASINYMFRGLTNCTHIDLANCDTSEIRHFYWTFAGNYAHVNFDDCDLSNLVSLYQFHLNTQYIDFSKQDFYLTDFSYSMYGSGDMEYLDLTGAHDDYLNGNVEKTLDNARNLKKVYVNEEWKTSFGKGFLENGGYITTYEKIPLIVKPIEPIPDTTFKLTGISDYGNEYTLVATTDEDGNIEFLNLEKGTYELREIKENDEYVLNETVWKVIVDENGKVTTIEPTDEEDRDRLYQVGKSGISDVVYNEPRYWDFEIEKVDKDNPEITLEGAVFQLSGVSDLGTVYNIEGTSDENGRIKFEHLERGTYLLKEIVPPTNVDENGKKGGNISYNYDLTEYLVKVDYSGTVTCKDLTYTDYNVLRIKNEKTESGKITITKKWVDTTDEKRVTPKLHLLTTEPDLNYETIMVTLPITVEPSTITEKPYVLDQVEVVLEDEEGNIVDTSVISNWLKAENGNPVYYFKVLKDPSKKYYVRQAEQISPEYRYEAERVEVVDRKAEMPNTYCPAVFELGSTVNSRMNSLANNNKANIHRFERSETPPPSDDYMILSTYSSLLPIYGWYEDNTIYYYSEAKDIYLNVYSNNFFAGCSNLDNPDIGNLITKYTSNYRDFFKDCSSLKISNIKDWDITSAYTMEGFYRGCTSLESIEELAALDTSRVQDMDYLFEGCTSLTDVDFSPVETDRSNTYLTGLFKDCTSLKNINFGKRAMAGINRRGNFSQMFSGCINLETVDLSMAITDSYDSTTYSLYRTFYNCEKLQSVKLPSGLRITSLQQAFMNCYSLEEISFNRDGRLSTNIESAFENCVSLKEIDLSKYYMSSITNANRAFYSCSSLENIFISNPFYFSNSTTSTDMFAWASNLPNFDPDIVDKTNAHYNEGGYLTYKDKNAATGISNNSRFALGDLFDSFLSTFTPKTIYAEDDLPNQDPQNNTPTRNLQNDKGAIPIGDGNYEWITDDDKWVKNGDTWTYTFDVFDDSIKYYLYEEHIDGYLSDAMDNYIIINEPNVTKSAIITNTEEDEYSSLTLKKELDKGNIYRIIERKETRYSHTPNISDDGTSTENYSNGLSLKDIIHIPGATSLHVRLNYETESSYDRVLVWEGDHSEINPYNSYYIDQDTYRYVYSVSGTLSGGPEVWEGDVQGDTATISFCSDGSVNNYGYYAVIEATIIDKEIEGKVEEIPESEYDREFEFTITLNGPDLAGNKVFDGILFVDGVAKVKLKANESLTIHNLPKDYTYSVVETEVQPYEVEYQDESGLLKEIETVPTHVRKISKTPNIDDDGNKNGLYPERTYGRDVVTIPLASQLHITIKHTFISTYNEDTGCFYKGISTSDASSCYSSVTGYLFGDDINDPANTKEYTVEGDTVTFVYRSGRKYSTDSNSYGYYAIIEGDYYPEHSTDVEAIATNYYTKRVQKPVDITLRKEESGYFSEGETYHFKILLANLYPDTEYKLSDQSTFTTNSNGEAIVDVYLKGGEEIKVLELPVGATYQVFEDAGDYYSNYHITDNNDLSLINQTSNGNTSMNKPLSTEVEKADEGEDVVITFVNTLDRTKNLSLRKQVDGNSTNKKFRFNILIEYLKPNSEYYSTIGKLTSDEDGTIEKDVEIADGEVVEFYNLAVGATYSIKENDYSTDGYTTFIKMTGSDDQTIGLETSGSISEAKDEDITFINVESIKLTGKKTWNDDNLEHDNEKEIKLKVIQTDFEGNEVVLSDYTIKWDKDEYLIDGLPKYDENGRPYTYRVEEEDMDQYASEVSADEDNNVYDFINTKDKGKLTIKKIVTVGDTDKEFTFTIKLFNSMGEPLNGTFSGVVFENGVGTIKLKHNESKTIETYVGVTYSIEEAQEQGYLITYDENREGTITKEEINTEVKNEEKPEGSLTVSKEVTGDGVDYDDVFTIEIVLGDTSINGTYSGVEFTNGKATLKLKGNESKTIEGLPKGVTYTVTETDSRGYTAEYEGSEGEISEDESSIAVVKNHRDSELTEYTVTKKWEDSNNKYKKRPTSITVYLYADGTLVNQTNLSEQNGWKYTFKELPKTKRGKDIVYSVKEKEVAGYSVRINGNVITNTYNPPSTTPPTNRTPTPDTGDPFNLMMNVMLFGGSVVVFIFMLLMKKRYMKE